MYEKLALLEYRADSRAGSDAHFRRIIFLSVCDEVHLEVYFRILVQRFHKFCGISFHVSAVCNSQILKFTILNWKWIRSYYTFYSVVCICTAMCPLILGYSKLQCLKIHPVVQNAASIFFADLACKGYFSYHNTLKFQLYFGRKKFGWILAR